MKKFAILFSLCFVASHARILRQKRESEPRGIFDFVSSLYEKIPDNAFEKGKEVISNLPIDKVKEYLTNYADQFDIKENIQDFSDFSLKIKDSFSNLSLDDGFEGLKKLAKDIPDEMSVSEGLKAITDYVPKEILEDETLNKYYDDIKGQAFQLFGGFFSKKE